MSSGQTQLRWLCLVPTSHFLPRLRRHSLRAPEARPPGPVPCLCPGLDEWAWAGELGGLTGVSGGASGRLAAPASPGLLGEVARWSPPGGVLSGSVVTGGGGRGAQALGWTHWLPVVSVPTGVIREVFELLWERRGWGMGEGGEGRDDACQGAWCFFNGDTGHLGTYQCRFRSGRSPGQLLVMDSQATPGVAGAVLRHRKSSLGSG